MDKTKFIVRHYNNASLGTAVMQGKRVTYKTDVKAYAWFEARPDEWLREFRAVVRRLCRSCGHWGKYSIVKDEGSGIEVERVG